MKPEHQHPTGPSMLVSYYDWVTGSGQLPYEEAVRQAVENAIDANGTKINVLIDEQKSFHIIDDGESISKEKVNGLNTVHVPNKLPGEGKIGKNNSGRLQFLRPAGEIVYRFASKDYPDVMRHHFTRSDLLELLGKVSIENPSPSLRRDPVVEKNIPDWLLDAEGVPMLGNGKTGTALELVEIDWRLFHGIDAFREELKNILSVWSARMTYVNNELIPKRPQIQDEFEGEKVAIDQKKYPRLGKTCDFFFYRCNKPGLNDYVYLGKNPLCSIKDFLKPVRDRGLKSEMPDYLTSNKYVSGFIHIPLINEHADHTRNGIKPDFYDDPERAEQVIYFFKDVIHQKLLARYPDLRRLEESDERREESQSAIQILSSMFPSGRSRGTDIVDSPIPDGPRITGEPKPYQEIVIVPSKSQVVMGQEVVIHVSRGRRGGKWNAAKCGGEISIEQNGDIRYTAGQKPGKYRLEYTCNKGKKVVPIEIVVERPFQLVPGRVQMYPGEPKDVYIHNYDGENVTFEIFDRESKKQTTHIKCENLGKMAHITARRDCRIGLYRLMATAPGGEKDEGVIEVVPPLGDDLHKIGSNWYAFAGAIDPMKNAIVESVMKLQDTPPDGEGEVFRMRINTENEFLKEIEREHGKDSPLYRYKIGSDVVYTHFREVKSEDPLQDTTDYMLEIMKEQRSKKKRMERRERRKK